MKDYINAKERTTLTIRETAYMACRAIKKEEEILEKREQMFFQLEREICRIQKNIKMLSRKL